MGIGARSGGGSEDKCEETKQARGTPKKICVRNDSESKNNAENPFCIRAFIHLGEIVCSMPLRFSCELQSLKAFYASNITPELCASMWALDKRK